MIPHMAALIYDVIARSAEHTGCGTCEHFRRYNGHLKEWGRCAKLPLMTPTKDDWTFCQEHTPMPLKPRIKVKAKGIPIGSYDAIADAAGKMKIKPKRKRKPLPQEIASRKRKKWRAAK